MSQLLHPIADPASVDAAIVNRFSARAFLPRPVERDTIADILRVAARAPSGSNTQRWRVHVVQGQTRDSLVHKVCRAHDAIAADPSLAGSYRQEFDYYPPQWDEPYLGRRRENGWGLYGLLDIHKGERDKMHAQHQRNYHFFDAPVGLFVTTDRRTGVGALLDCGMFLQNIMVAARARGLHTCPQAAWNPFASIVLPHLGAGEQEMLVAAVALGWADESAPVNGFHTPREPLESFACWLD